MLVGGPLHIGDVVGRDDLGGVASAEGPQDAVVGALEEVVVHEVDPDVRRHRIFENFVRVGRDFAYFAATSSAVANLTVAALHLQHTFIEVRLTSFQKKKTGKFEFFISRVEPSVVRPSKIQ